MFFLILVLLAISIVLNVILYFRNVHPNGNIVIMPGEEGKKIFSLEIDKSPDEIQQMDTIIFKVVDRFAE